MRSLFFCPINACEKPRRAINKTVNLPDLFISTLARGTLVACLLAMLAGCKTQPVEPKAPPVVQSTMRGADESSKVLPPDLYKTMPMYPGAVVEHVRKPKGAMREILFSAQGDLPTMVAYYKDELKKNDFHITSSLIMPARKTWSCDFHNRGRPGSIMLFPSDTDKTRMTIDLIYELPAHIDESMMEPREDFDVKGPGEIAQQATNLNSNPNPNPSEKEKRN
jgi:hypothetical protein